MPSILDTIRQHKPGDPPLYLPRAALYRANLQGACLGGANMYGANLQGANMYGAYLQGAYLQGAYLQGADLQGANLYGANLRGANLRGAKLDDTTVIDTGETWKVYLEEVVPVLQVMYALSNNDVPELLRPRWGQYLMFNSSGLIVTASLQPTS